MIRLPRPTSALLALAGLTLAACGSDDPSSTAAPATAPAAAVPTSTPEQASTTVSAAPATDDSMTDTTTDSMADTTTDSTTDSMTDSMTDTVAVEDLAAWQTLPITDVTGTTFTLADLAGTPVVLEFFATWCPKCRDQLGETNAAAAVLGADAHVIALSVETDLDPDDVAAYASDNGFDSIRFAVMSPELLAAMVDAFGPTAANPPSTPKVVIDAMLGAGELTTGAESADDLVAAVRG